MPATLVARKTKITDKYIRTTQTTSWMSVTMLKQSTFDWQISDKSNGLHNFEIEIRNIFLTNSYNIKSKRVPVIPNWFGHGFKLIHT